MAAQPTANVKPYGITNIKAYVPLILGLNQLNYDAWCVLFETHCRAYSVHDHLDGTSRPTNAADTEWSTLDSLVAMWIYNTLTQPLLTMVLKENSTAHEVWCALEGLFRDNKDARAIELENDLRNMTLGDSFIIDFCQKLNATADLLANIGSPAAAKTLVTYLLNGLSPKFDHITMVIRHRIPLPTFLEARSMLRLEETRFYRTCRTTSVHTDHSFVSTVLHTGQPSRDNSNRRDTCSSNNQDNRQRNRDNNRRDICHGDHRQNQPPSSGHPPDSYPPPWGCYPPPWGPYGWSPMTRTSWTTLRNNGHQQ